MAWLNRDLGSFVQSYGSRELDASLLLLPTMGFLKASDLRIRRTVEAILACSFWLADADALMGRTDDARRLFERLLALRNDVGLCAPLTRL